MMRLAIYFFALGAMIGRHGRVLAKSGSATCGSHPLKDHLYPDWGDYHAAVMPPGQEGQPLRIQVDGFIVEIGPLNLDQDTFRIQLTLRQRYRDPRLAHHRNDPVQLLAEHVRATIWTPDTFFRNVQSAQMHDTFGPNMYARIYMDGEVYLSARLTLQVSCAGMATQMRDNLSADCHLDLASYGLPDTSVQYEWAPGRENAFLVSEKSHFLGNGVALTSLLQDHCQAVTSTGTYSCLRLKLLFSKL